MADVAVLNPSTGDFSDIQRVGDAISSLAARISKEFAPDLIVQISDLSSPGGLVVGSELQAVFDVPPPLVAARVQSAHGDDRIVVEIVGVPGLINRKILIVDDVVFSGTTISRVLERISVMFRGSEIAVACLVLHAASPAKRLLQGRIAGFFFADTTLNREIRFPWGIAEWYGELSIQFGATHFCTGASKRPWGYYEEFALNKKCPIRIHTIGPNQRMSLQRHFERDEFFVPLDVGVSYVLADKEISSIPGDYVFVPRGEWHRIANRTGRPVRVLEVAFGTYDQVNDIERYEDDYGRVNAKGDV